jgi:hypothetical protein
MTITIQICYEVISPESAEHGDTADHGFYSGGWQYSIADEDFQRLADLVGHTEAVKRVRPSPEPFDSLDDAIEFLDQYGPFEASCYPPQAGCWLTQADASVDYSTGEEIRLSFHLNNVSPEQHMEIVRAVL